MESETLHYVEGMCKIWKRDEEHGMIEENGPKAKNIAGALGVSIPRSIVNVECIHTRNKSAYANEGFCFVFKIKTRRIKRASRDSVLLGSRVTRRCSLQIMALLKAHEHTETHASSHLPRSHIKSSRRLSERPGGASLLGFPFIILLKYSIITL